MNYRLAMAMALVLAWSITATAQDRPDNRRPEEPSPSGDVPPGPPGPPRGLERGPMGPGGFDQMGDKDIRELIETVKMVRLSKELGLTQEQTVVLVGQYNEFKAQIEKLNQERQERLRDLKEAVRTDSDNERIQKALDALMEHDAKITETRRAAFNEVGKDLTIKQKAKLYVFLQEFDQDMRRLIQRARERGQGPAMNGPMMNRFREMREGRQGGFPPQGGPGRQGPPPLPGGGRPQPQDNPQP